MPNSTRSDQRDVEYARDQRDVGYARDQRGLEYEPAGVSEAGVRVARPAARILLVDAAGRVLLFRFTPPDRAPLWCTPGGAVDPGESYEAAARRELWEETGLDHDCGPQVARRVVDFLTFERVEVTADERWFRVDVDQHTVVGAALTEQERELMAEARWFARDELADWPEIIYPTDLLAMLKETDVHAPHV